MASVLSNRLRRLEGKLRPDGIQYIIAAPPVCQTEEEWIEKYTPRPHDGQEEVIAGDIASGHLPTLS
jgi:hypothetical protein